MSIAIAIEGLVPGAPLADALPAANAGLPTDTGSADASGVPGTSFDAALQACLTGLPMPGNTDVGEPGEGNVDGQPDESVPEPSSDETQAQETPGIPALLTALLPSVHAATWLAPSRAAASDTPTESASARLSGAVAASADVLSRPVSLPVGMNASAGQVIAAGQVGAGAPQAAARPAPMQSGAPSDAVQAPAVSSVLVGAPGAGSAKTEHPAAAAVVAATQGAPASEGGKPLSADGAERVLSASVLPVAPADAGISRSSEVVLRLPNGDTNQWRQPLMQALGERLQFASERGVDSAVIRLEPPRMGSIEIAIRHQDGVLQVNLSATHNDVLRQLQDISDGLRHNLGQRHAGDVTVQVTEAATPRSGPGDGERQRQRQAQSEQEPGRALGDAETEGAGPSFRLVRNEE